MKFFISILIAFAVSSPLASANTGNQATSASMATDHDRGDNSGSNCSHAKKKLNIRNSDTNPNVQVTASEVLGTKDKGVQ